MLYPRVSLYALMLAAAGIPLYIHLPRFAAVNLGLGLGVIGTVLLVIRLVDLVQDPLIGWSIDRWPRGQLFFAAAAALGLAVGFPVLFNLPENTSVSALVITLILLFSAYSLGTILLYGRSATLAKKADAKELMVLAAYREGGQLAGVVIAAAAPALFVALGAGAQGYPAFGLFLGGLAVCTLILTVPMWRRAPITGQGLSFAGLGEQPASGNYLDSVSVFCRGPAAIAGQGRASVDPVFPQRRGQRAVLGTVEQPDWPKTDSDNCDAPVDCRLYRSSHVVSWQSGWLCLDLHRIGCGAGRGYGGSARHVLGRSDTRRAERLGRVRHLVFCGQAGSCTGRVFYSAAAGTQWICPRTIELGAGA